MLQIVKNGILYLLSLRKFLPSSVPVAVVRASPKLTNYRQKMVVFHQRSSSIKGRLPSKVVLHQRSSSIKGCLPSKVLFHQRSSSIKGYLPSKGASIKGCLPSKVIIKGRLPMCRKKCVQKFFFLSFGF